MSRSRRLRMRAVGLPRRYAQTLLSGVETRGKLSGQLEHAVGSKRPIILNATQQILNEFFAFTSRGCIQLGSVRRLVEVLEVEAELRRKHVRPALLAEQILPTVDVIDHVFDCAGAREVHDVWARTD